MRLHMIKLTEAGDQPVRLGASRRGPGEAGPTETRRKAASGEFPCDRDMSLATLGRWGF
jgi:hypothetical protein